MKGLQSTMHPKSFFPEGGIEVGLFFVSERPADDDSKPNFSPKQIIQMEEFQHFTYSDAKAPEPSDYYWCGSCREEHLRECFDGSPVVTGQEKWLRFFVELGRVRGYRRIKVDRPEPPFVDKAFNLDGIMSWPEVEFKNPSAPPWELDGWFLAYQGHIIGFELFNVGHISIPKDASLRLTPRVTL